MPKLSFLAGLAAGYVLGARAGRERYAQIKTVSGKVWQSKPVQKQVSAAKESARTKAAPVVADFVADAAKATGEKLRASRTIPSHVSDPGSRSVGEEKWVPTPGAPGDDPWAKATGH
ncbi:protoporphyrinogen oxidase [Knoellia sp. CPCC 206435]|uniref:protoporphyrinogen oxidase n=1 Tax=Knoellia terrae TaxID=3404797 RepID=UPI003B435A18